MTERGAPPLPIFNIPDWTAKRQHPCGTKACGDLYSSEKINRFRLSPPKYLPVYPPVNTKMIPNLEMRNL